MIDNVKRPSVQLVIIFHWNLIAHC